MLSGLDILGAGRYVCPTRLIGRVTGDCRLEDRARSCYKLDMPKTIEQWLLFKYIGGEFTPLSRPFKTKEQAEKALSLIHI